MNEEDWKKHDVEFYALPMRDFNGSASRNDIDHAVKFVDNIGNRGKSVYVFSFHYFYFHVPSFI